MSTSTASKLLTAFRVGLVVGAGGVTVLTVWYLASMPPPPPDSDGFAHGLAAMFGGGIILLSLGLATVSVILPSLLGRDDPLGFNRRQRLALQAAGGLIGLGVVSATVMGLSGVVLLLELLLLAFGIVCAILVWRGLQIVRDRRTAGEGAA